MNRLELIRSFYAAIPRELRAFVFDAEVVERTRALMAPHLTSDFHMLLCGPEDSGFEERYEGFEGFVRGWRSWIEAYDDYSFQMVDLFETGDFVVIDVTQQATLRGTTSAVEHEGTGIWLFRGDKLAGVEFHLDRERGHARAGLTTPSARASSE
jgi:hypothetical protein